MPVTLEKSSESQIIPEPKNTEPRVPDHKVVGPDRPTSSHLPDSMNFFKALQKAPLQEIPKDGKHEIVPDIDPNAISEPSKLPGGQTPLSGGVKEPEVGNVVGKPEGDGAIPQAQDKDNKAPETNKADPALVTKGPLESLFEPLTKKADVVEDAARKVLETLDEEVDKQFPENTAGMTPAAKSAFKKIRDTLKEEKRKAYELASQMDSLKTKVTAGPEVATALKALTDENAKIKEQMGLYESELRIGKLESHPQFKKEFTEPIKTIADKIKGIASVYELRPNELVEISDEADPVKRRALAKEMSSSFDPVDALEYRQSIEDLAKKKSDQQIVLKNSREALEGLSARQEAEKASRRVESDRQLQQSLRKAHDSIGESLPWLKKVDGNETWNKQIDAVLEESKFVFTQPLAADQQANVAVRASILPIVVRTMEDFRTKAISMISEKDKRISELETELRDISGASPGLGSGSPDTKSPTGSQAFVPFGQAMKQAESKLKLGV